MAKHWIKSLMPPAASEEHAEEKAKFLQRLYALVRSLDEVLIATKLEALAKYVQTYTYIYKDQETLFFKKMQLVTIVFCRMCTMQVEGRRPRHKNDRQIRKCRYE